MSLYDRVMRATEDPTVPLKANAIAQSAARIADSTGHSGIAAAAAGAAALVAAVNTVMHAPQAAPGAYAGFHDGPVKGR
ncbi:hypothetical protein PV703_11465 [Streptomyces sp. ME01-24h]|nr:hypothetical protein [Streptomyces sp. ME01-24h]